MSFFWRKWVFGLNHPLMMLLSLVKPPDWWVITDLRLYCFPSQLIVLVHIFLTHKAEQNLNNVQHDIQDSVLFCPVRAEFVIYEQYPQYCLIIIILFLQLNDHRWSFSLLGPWSCVCVFPPSPLVILSFIQGRTCALSCSAVWTEFDLTWSPPAVAQDGCSAGCVVRMDMCQDHAPAGSCTSWIHGFHLLLPMNSLWIRFLPSAVTDLRSH